MNTILKINDDNEKDIRNLNCNNNITKIIIDGCYINPIEVYFLNSNGNVRFPNLKELEIYDEIDGYDFLGKTKPFTNLEFIKLNGIDDSYNSNIEFDKPLLKLKKLEIVVDIHQWKIFLNNYKFVPNIDTVIFDDFDNFDYKILAEDLLKFPKIKKIILKDSTFIEEAFITRSTEFLSKLKNLEEITALVLKDIKSINNFKKLNQIETLWILDKNSSDEVKRETKNIKIKEIFYYDEPGDSAFDRKKITRKE